MAKEASGEQAVVATTVAPSSDSAIRPLLGQTEGSAGTPSGSTTSSARDSQRWEVGWKL